MIVPEKRLIAVTASLFLPLALLSAFAPESATMSVLIGMAFVLLVGVDAGFVYSRRYGIAVDFPDRLDLSRHREEALAFDVVNRTGSDRDVLFGLQLPIDLTSSQESLRARVPEGKKLRLTWPLLASQRGVYQLGPCHFRLFSLLGFWTFQGVLPVKTQVHVYPDLLSARKQLAAMLNNCHEMQIHARRQVGQGREFEKLRPYVAGDSLADISWKGTAKRGHLITKQYQIERTQEVYVVIDSSRLSSRRMMEPLAGGLSQNDHLLEHYITAALLLGMVAQGQGDLFGLMAFSDRVHSFVRANTGKKHFGLCRDALYGVHPHMVTPDFEEMASFLGTRLRKRALILVLTSLDEPALAEDFVRAINVLNHRHLVLVSMLRPKDAKPIFSDDVASSDEIYRALGGHLLWHNLRELREMLRQRGVEFSMLESGRLFADLVSRYVEVKRRQLL